MPINKNFPPNVLVLMSTWNGELFLEEQLNSIFSQTYEGDWHLLVRDDGSSDKTKEILGMYDQSRLTFVCGSNMGVKASFLELIDLAKSVRADYYVLADQDDVWHKDKLSRAIEFIAGSAAPALYCSSVDLVDHNLKYISTYVHPGDRSFVSTFFCNYVTGCTAVFNRALLDKLRFPKNPSQILMHDWWIASIAAAFGVVFYDSKSFIKYRQHANNQVGIKRGLIGIISRFIKALEFKNAYARKRHAMAFLDAYSDQMSDVDKKNLCAFVDNSENIFKRIRFTWSVRSSVSVIAAIRYIIFR